MKRLALLLALALSACEPVASSTSTTERQPITPQTTEATTSATKSGVVTKHVDGDTFWIDGKSTRLIGIDTPETVHPKLPKDANGDPIPECFGREASKYVAEILPKGSLVYLEFDVETMDRDRRQLAYVYTTQGIMVNLELVKQGYATAYPYGSTRKHRAKFAAAEAEAIAAKRGLWGAC